MASYADAYGYTPENFMSLTLPNLTHFGDYAKKQAEAMEKSSSKGSGFSSSNTGSISKNSDNKRQGKWKSGTSIESLIGMYGTPEAKKNIMGEILSQPAKKEPPKP
jgi:hypothetical protein